MRFASRAFWGLIETFFRQLLSSPCGFAACVVLLGDPLSLGRAADTLDLKWCFRAGCFYEWMCLLKGFHFAPKWGDRCFFTSAHRGVNIMADDGFPPNKLPLRGMSRGTNRLFSRTGGSGGGKFTYWLCIIIHSNFIFHGQMLESV